jgi:IstB-like ATP binding protein
MRTFTGPSVLVVDELGYLPMDQTSAHWIFQVVSRRYERGSIVLTSNRGFFDWGQVFAPGGGRGDLGPAPAPRHGREHQGQELPDAPAPGSAGQGEGVAYDLSELCTFRDRLTALFVIANIDERGRTKQSRLAGDPQKTDGGLMIELAMRYGYKPG